MSSNTNNENERTSLLASSSAPPPTQTQQQQQQPSSTLAEMEKSAKRLADDNLGLDSDSVNGLLAGMEGSDDEASIDTNGMFDDTEGGGDVTMTDLEYLASGGGAAAGGGGGVSRWDAGSNLVMHQTDNKASTSNNIVAGRKMVDKIGNELLKAEDNPELEQRILRHSLRLSAPISEDLLSQPPPGDDDNIGDEELRKQSFHAQSSHGSGIGVLSNRVHESTRALRASMGGNSMRKVPSVGGGGGGGLPRPPSHPEIEPTTYYEEPSEDDLDKKRPPLLTVQVVSMVALTLFVMLFLAAALALGTLAVGPPRQPLGEYKILEAQVGNDFWKYYDFYAGKDSAGSNGYINYVSQEVGKKEGIIEVITEEVPKEKMIEVYSEGDVRAVEDWLAEDLAFLEQLKRQKEEEGNAGDDDDDDSDDNNGNDKGSGSGETEDDKSDQSSTEKKKATTKKQKPANDKTKKSNRRVQTTQDDLPQPKLEPFNPDLPTPNSNNATTKPTETFVRISSSPTTEGPRNSIRLEGRRRFNRGLFIIDLRHMPAGCGTWPAFWLTDEANWPVNGEIDIVEGVNYQDTAKTALHTTRVCEMDDVPEGSKTGSWDTSVGIPNRKTGIPDMTFRYAQNCFVYDPHQWINQGCVATDLKLEGRSLGMPLNKNGGGVYALEWDPVNRHIKTWVFSPHGRVPRNLREALRTATEVDLGKRVAPDTNTWGLPYGHFPIGEGTNCPSGHFRNMRLVINLAFCGSVSGNRYFMDCPNQFKKHKTCNEYVASEPEELKEAYWKIRGVYVYEREWERQWT
ncbi:hypothetical protein ACHAXR_010188 [Thalassiosira sp. AJA248-18]